MPITELAQLQLLSSPTSKAPKSQQQPLDPTLLSNLQHAQQVLTKSSGHPFQFYRCIEDPNVIYIIGSWDDLEAHHKFLPSPDNQKLLELLKDHAEVKFMFHLEIDQVSSPIVNRTDQHNPTLSIARHFMSDGNRDQFQDSFTQNSPVLRSFLDSLGGALAGGWRIDEDQVSQASEGSLLEHKNEFVLFTSWPSVDKHFEFAQSKGFKKYAKIRDHLDQGAEIKHVVALQY